MDPANILSIVDTTEVKTRPIKSFGRLLRTRAPLRLNFLDQTVIHVQFIFPFPWQQKLVPKNRPTTLLGRDPMEVEFFGSSNHHVQVISKPKNKNVCPTKSMGINSAIEITRW